MGLSFHGLATSWLQNGSCGTRHPVCIHGKNKGGGAILGSSPLIPIPFIRQQKLIFMFPSNLLLFHWSTLGSIHTSSCKKFGEVMLCPFSLFIRKQPRRGVLEMFWAGTGFPYYGISMVHRGLHMIFFPHNFLVFGD